MTQERDVYGRISEAKERQTVLADQAEEQNQVNAVREASDEHPVFWIQCDRCGICVSSPKTGMVSEALSRWNAIAAVIEAAKEWAKTAGPAEPANLMDALCLYQAVVLLESAEKVE